MGRKKHRRKKKPTKEFVMGRRREKCVRKNEHLKVSLFAEISLDSFSLSPSFFYSSSETLILLNSHTHLSRAQKERFAFTSSAFGVLCSWKVASCEDSSGNLCEQQVITPFKSTKKRKNLDSSRQISHFVRLVQSRVGERDWFSRFHRTRVLCESAAVSVKAISDISLLVTLVTQCNTRWFWCYSVFFEFRYKRELVISVDAAHVYCQSTDH